MSTINPHKHNTHHGFTIVELLIVIVVIAILAAISIAAYTNIRNRANDSVIKQDLANFAKAAKLYYAENGVFPSPASSELSVLKLSASKNSYDSVGYNLYYCTNATANGGAQDKFAFAAKSKSGNNFYVTQEGGGAVGVGGMSAGQACDRIGAEAKSGNLSYAYTKPLDGNPGYWSSWVQ